MFTQIGHALGLGHSNDRNAIMFGMYFESPKYDQLTAEDIRMIEEIYGRCRQRRSLPHKTSVPPCSTKTTTTVAPENSEINQLLSQPKPNICNTNFDAVTMFRGQLWLFKNQVGFMYIMFLLPL